MSDFLKLTDLASERFGAMVEYANDEFFAEKENLISQAEPVFDAARYTDHGKWMDGWESRRRRVPGHDHCIIRLGLPGVIRGVVVDTSYFTGNFPEHCSIEAACLSGRPGVDTLRSESIEWREILPKSALEGNSKNLFEILYPQRYTHLRFNIFPDGGVARLRVYGEPVPNWRRLLGASSSIDLAASANGGRALGANDSHYGEPANLLLPGRGIHMGDGWETRRSRGGGNDWVVVQLAAEARVESVVVDTCHFKGNYPDTCSVEAVSAPGSSWEELQRGSVKWAPLLSRTSLGAHAEHIFDESLEDMGPVTHVRLSIYPDGGVSRFRVFGRVVDKEREALLLDWLNGLAREDFAKQVQRCCSSSVWLDNMFRGRPFVDREELLERSAEVFAGLDREDLMEAFASHPRIGAKKSAGQDTTANTWSAEEQSRTKDAKDDVLDELAATNLAYEEKFGYTYIVCATGRSALEMLDLAKARLSNDPDKELGVARHEQSRITDLRLTRLLNP